MVDFTLLTVTLFLLRLVLLLLLLLLSGLGQLYNELYTASANRIACNCMRLLNDLQLAFNASAHFDRLGLVT